jgi:hypothetical protein
MRTHPPAFVQAYRVALAPFAHRFKLKRAPNTLPQSVRVSPLRLCAILLRHRASSTRLSLMIVHHHRACASPSISCAVPGIVSHRVLRCCHASRARNELAWRSVSCAVPAGIVRHCVRRRRQLLLLQRRALRAQRACAACTVPGQASCAIVCTALPCLFFFRAAHRAPRACAAVLLSNFLITCAAGIAYCCPNGRAASQFQLSLRRQAVIHNLCADGRNNP